MGPEEFFAELMQEVHVRADATGSFTDEAFAEVVTEHLIETGSIDDFVARHYLHRGVRVDGYHFSPEEGVLELFVVDCRQGTTAPKMTKAELEQVFRKAEAFFVKSCQQTFLDQMETSHPAFSLSRMIFEQSGQIRTVRFCLLTNARLTGTVKELPSKSNALHEWSYRVWDLDRLAKIIGTGKPEEIVVDFVRMFGKPLVCLPAGNGVEDVRSYLAVIPGDWLAAIYDTYGGRLLEQNVRTFLQARGKVNKGIRKTILEEPQRFFPYNNGISATAEAIDETHEGGVSLVRSLKNLQIVNGGQTTASIFNVMKKDRSPTINAVSVPMKLSVVQAAIAEELVPKISRFANSQNRISDSDFFSNHPFHVVMQTLSAKLAAPATEGSQILTHWFYERAKGQYANAMAYLSPAKKKEFLLRNPRSQVIAKTDLAKYVQTFRERPQEVSLGAQKNFAKFAEWLSAEWEGHQADFNEHWFRRAVAEAIIFRTAEKAVQGAPWYAQGYRANTVTYGIALLMNRIRAKGLGLDVQRLWREQMANDIFRRELLECCRIVQETIIESASRYGVINVSEWCKQKQCWEVVIALPYQPSDALLQTLKTRDDERSDVMDARRERKAVGTAESYIAVVNAGAQFWAGVRHWAMENGEVRPSDMTLLDVACAMPRRLPSERQCVRLMEIRGSFEECGSKSGAPARLR